MQDRPTAEATASTKHLIAGATGDWEIIIGLEVHAQVNSQAKLFSGAATGFGAEPNSHVSFVDAAMPGMLPVINSECVRQAVRTGLGLKAQINLRSTFDRKNYFYPDLPQGYQISQFKHPIVGEGEVRIEADDEDITVGIERLHLEQDAGKSIHDQHPEYSYVDLNRSGVALMEIVSRPDMRSAEQAKAYVSKLRSILRYLGTCDGDMEKGNLRADVNVSVRRPGAELGTRCEIKNVNSIRFIGQAIDYEARRQIDLIEDGGKVHQQTRLFDSATGQTRSMRSKEEAHDYRYFPDPDLLPLEFSQDFVDDLKADLPELPDEKHDRFVTEYGLSAYDANVLVAEKDRAAFFEQVVLGGASAAGGGKSGKAKAAGKAGKTKARRDGKAAGKQPASKKAAGGTSGKGKKAGGKKAGASSSAKTRRDGKATANWVINEFFGRLNKEGLEISQSPMSADQLGGIIDLIADKSISGKIAKDLFEIVWGEGGDPLEIVEKRGMKQVTDPGAIEKAVDEVIAANPGQVEKAKEKPSLAGWFVGQVMKATGGKANPQAVNDLVKKKLGVE